MTVPRNRAPLALGALLLATVGAVLLFGVLPALRHRQALAAVATERADEAPRVVFVVAGAASPGVKVALPARLAAQQQVALYPQAGGTLGRMQADVGDHVAAGQVLVQVETPVLDRQVEQNRAACGVARAKIDLARAKLDFAKATLARLRSVGDARAVSQQVIDEAAANVKGDEAGLAAAEADLAAAEADGHRLEALRTLARIVAPFDGEVTERNYDIGMLVVADRTEGTRPAFRIIDREEIRAFVDVPQSLAAGVAVGIPMRVTVRELPGRTFDAKVVRVAPSLDDGTRTRLVEARIDNRDHAILPGMFADASLELARPHPAATVPGEAIVIREGRPAIAEIGPDDAVRYASVQLGRDTGTVVEVLEGIAPGARVAVSLSQQPPDGTKVRAVPRPTQ